MEFVAVKENGGKSLSTDNQKDLAYLSAIAYTGLFAAFAMIAIWLLPTALMSPPLSTTASDPTSTKSTLSMTYATAESRTTVQGIPAELKISCVLTLTAHQHRCNNYTV